MKKFAFIIFGTLFFTQNALAVATVDNSYSTVDAPYISLEATDLGDGSVRTTWKTEYFTNMDNFTYWKVVRSNTNSSPVYPDDGYIFYDTDVEADSYIDTNPKDGINYYRVCGITNDKTRYCSNVVKLDIDKEDSINTESGYRNVTKDDNLELELEVEEDGNLLSWTANEYDNFVYWKLIRSKSNASPSYPEDGYIFYSNYADTTEYLDESPTSAPVYYRVCAITSDRYRYCSNVIYFDPETGESEQKICTMEYDPVCGKDGKTYSNDCRAEAADVEVDYEGACEDDEEIFSDTKQSQYQKAIQYVKRKGIVDGYSDGTYRPENKINRAEFTKILILAIYSEDDLDDCNLDGFSFTDASSNQWYAKYVCLAKREGIIGGYTDGTFRPGNEINLAEALKIILLTYDVELPETDSTEWYARYWSYALKNSLLPDTITSVNQEINRGEMAEIIYNIENE